MTTRIMTKNPFLFLIIFLSGSGFLLLTKSCISPIEYNTNETEFTAISGVITNSLPESHIRITRNIGLSTESIPIEAEGYVYCNDSLAAQMVLIADGSLVVPPSVQIEEGKNYFIEIITAEGNTYRSRPQTVLPKLETDSVSFRIDVFQDGFLAHGGPRYVNHVSAIAHTTIPDTISQTLYYRWQLDESWEFIESFGLGKTCYLTAGVEEHPSTILSSEDLAPGSAVAVRIGTRPVGESFLHRHYYNAYLQSIDQEAYDFYRKAERLSQAEGSIYDEIPAPIRGNLYNVNDSTEWVLGYVDFALADTARLLIHGYDLDLNITNNCLFIPPPCANPPDPTVPPPPCKCNNCDLVFGSNTLIKPPYWD